ncbi:MAG: MaoC family dehydratase N-terminal domain-containing protein [Gammaproteobacteria bacterium]|nr:MaoC family dehydratase N-terminal domain-containing protein [Gammaproteobacteria bacterium]
MDNVRVVVGDKTEFSKTVGESDIYGFAGITGDFAPPHMNEEFMKKSQYGHRVAHGALTVGFMSTASAQMAGRVISETDSITPMSIGYDRVRFVGPVFIGDTVTVTYTITEIDAATRRSKADLIAANQKGETVAVATHIMKWLENP